MEKHHEILKQAIEQYGHNSQLTMVIEESAELIKAITKYKRFPNVHTLRNVHDECADVLIMIEQVKLMLDCDKEINERITFKVSLLASRLSTKLTDLKTKKESLTNWIQNHDAEHPDYYTVKKDLSRVLKEIKDFEEKELLTFG